MADQLPEPDSDEHTTDEPGVPRWVKAFGIVAALVVLLIGLIVATGLGGQHGPQRHGPGGDAGGYALPSSAA